MSANSYEVLYELYEKLGNAHACRANANLAADAFALALYYARRMGKQELAEYCRQLVAECEPDHVAARETVAPLLFAQLLIRYPAEQIEETIAELEKTAPTNESWPPRTEPVASEPIAGEPQVAEGMEPVQEVFTEQVVPTLVASCQDELLALSTTTQELSSDGTRDSAKPDEPPPSTWSTESAEPGLCAASLTAEQPTGLSVTVDSVEAAGETSDPVIDSVWTAGAKPTVLSSECAHACEQLSGDANALDQPPNHTESRAEQTVADPSVRSEHTAREEHHLFDLGTHSGRPASEQPAFSLATDDAETARKLSVTTGLRDERVSGFESIIHTAGIVAVVCGITAIGFFSLQLVPALARLDLHGVLRAMAGAKSTSALALPESKDEWALDAKHPRDESIGSAPEAADGVIDTSGRRDQWVRPASLSLDSDQSRTVTIPTIDASPPKP